MRNYFPTRNKKFGFRLKTLMDYNGLDRMDLATYLCGYNQKPKSGTTEYDTCRKKSRTITEHLKLEDIQKEASLSAKYIADYCEILHCEPDYLFGYIDFPTHTETNINKEIGLSDKSIETLQEWKKSLEKRENQKLLVRNKPTDTLNLLLSNPFIAERLFKSIEDYIHHDYHIPAYHNDSGQCITFKDWQDVVKDCDGNISAYSLTLLKDNTDDMRDNRKILIDENFLDTVALKNVEHYLFQLQQKIITEKKE